MTPSPQSAEAQEREFEAHLLKATWHQVMVQAKDDDDEGASIYRMCRMAAREAWNARSFPPVQEAEAGVSACVTCGQPVDATELPDWHAVSDKVAEHGRDGLTPLELFILDNEPAGPDENTFRDQLRAAIDAQRLGREKAPQEGGESNG